MNALEPGLVHTFTYRVPEERTVPHLFPDIPEFAEMPRVLATGYMVGLVEWACAESLMPFIDWPRELSLGTRLELTHEAATPPGMDVSVHVTLVEIDGRRLRFEVLAEDELDVICRGSHERYLVDVGRFEQGLIKKRSQASGALDPPLPNTPPAPTS